jgi:hypothetical protein
MKDTAIEHIGVNHKGEQCQYKAILCQEGYCNECQIYIDWCNSLWE